MNRPTFHIGYKLNGHLFTAVFENSYSDQNLSIAVHTDESRIKCTVKPTNKIEITEFSANLKYSFSKFCRVLLNGYQSWTDTFEMSINDKQHKMLAPRFITERIGLNAYGDYNFAKTGGKGDFHGFSYGYIRMGTQYELFGSANERTGFTQIVFNTNKSEIALIKDVEGLLIDSEYEILHVIHAVGTENEVFDAYFKAQGVDAPKAKPVVGYTSWYNHYQDIDEGIILNDLKSITESDLSFDVFQIDDGFEPFVGDWLYPNEAKFPRGLKPIVDEIHSNGMLAGLWLAPFECEKDSKFYREHFNWLLKDENGDGIVSGNNWSGSFALDIYNEDLRSYLREVFDRVLNEWDFDLVKLDFLYACCIVPQHGKTRGQVMAEGMDFIRECVGDKLILGCGVPLASAFGMVDYCRIGCDVSLDWNDKLWMQAMHRERISTKNCIQNSLFRRQLNGRGFMNDPDVSILRDSNLMLTEDQKEILCRINNLCGGLVFTSDDVSSLGSSHLNLMRECRKLSDAKVISVSKYNELIRIEYELDGSTHHFDFNAKNGTIL